MRRIFILLFILYGLPLALIQVQAHAQPQAPAASAVIATASNFQPAMKDLVKVFHAQQPHQLVISAASSGVLFNQISQGAPFDVLLSADTSYPKKVGQQGLGDDSSRFTYALGQLALVSHSDISNIDPKQYLAQLLNNKGRIAIANTATAPYGIAAQQALETLQLWPVPPKQLISGSNVGQAFQFVATKNTDVGFVALSQAQLLAQNSSLNFLTIPQAWYQPIQQQAILLQSGQHNPAALAFLAFLKTEQAKAIIQDHGYKLAN